MSNAKNDEGDMEAPIADIGLGYVNDNFIHDQDLSAGDSWHAKLQRMAGRFGVEQRGIERVPEDARTDTSISTIGTLWMSANMVVSSFAIGALAISVFDLGFVDAALTILFVNVLGIMTVCFFSTFGPRFGLRQMVVSRFWFGYYGVKLIAIFNILACIGWSATNVIVGAQLFHAVDENMPGWIGIVIIALLTLLICLFGYRLIHIYERWAWLPCFLIFLVIMVELATSGQFNSLLPLATGPNEAGAILSFAASVYGFAAGWSSFAADYTVYQPVHRSRTLVFLWTFGGLLIPLTFTELLGAAVMTAAQTNEDYSQGYQTAGIGGLLASVLVPRLGRWGQFCIVVLALSTVANNCPNLYSVSLSLQVLAKETQRVPRFIWTLLATCAYVAISIPGYDHFAPWLENFMLVIAYWLAIYSGISIPEHFVFRRGFDGYRPEDYTNPNALPPGIAALGAFFCGATGAFLGMAQVWWTGPIGRLCGGSYGGDVGLELAFCFSAVSYIVLRTHEKRRHHR